MALSTLQNQIVASATGFSDSIFLDEKPEGQDWTVFVRSGTFGDTDIQISDNGTDWGDAKDSAGVINFIANGSFRSPGGIYLRMDVNSYSAAITLVAK